MQQKISGNLKDWSIKLVLTQREERKILLVTSNNGPGLFQSHSTHRGCWGSLLLWWQMHMWWMIIIAIWTWPVMKLPPFGHAAMYFLRRQSRGIATMMAGIPAEWVLARFIIISGGMGGVALMAPATRSLHVAEATSTTMTWRLERAGAMILVTMRMSGPWALGARCVMVVVPVRLIILHNIIESSQCCGILPEQYGHV